MHLRRKPPFDFDQAAARPTFDMSQAIGHSIVDAHRRGQPNARHRSTIDLEQGST
jgi:hypothetical protein